MVIFDYNDAKSRQALRPQVAAAITRLAGERLPQVENAVAEAVINGLASGKSVRIRVRRLGTTLYIRVSDAGPGFAGNQAVAAILAAGTEKMLHEHLLETSGRGLPIMLAWMDRVIYNKAGNEVLLVKKLGR